MVLKKKLEWQAEYFENFGHCESNPYKAAQMRLCCRLIDIICWGRAYLHGEKQKLRYQKAYALLFKIMFENVMEWWD